MTERRDRGRRGRRRGYGPTGFEEAGGYMAAKIAKLEDQYKTSVKERSQGIFNAIAIFVNGYTEPSSEELKRIMMTNGGTYHHYFSRSKTTHIIANNLPDTKIKNLNTNKIVSPKWITESLEAGHLLDYTKYILYTNQSRSQPKLPFKPISTSEKNSDTSTGKSSIVHSKEHPPLVPDTEDHQETSTGSPTFDTSLSLKETKLPTEVQSINDIEIKLDGPTGTSDLTSVHNYSPMKTHSMSTANSGFLSEFYNNSRLHHISTMGAMFKQYVNELQSKNMDFPGRKDLLKWLKTKNGLMSSSEGSLAGDSALKTSLVSISKKKGKRIVMHIDMDCFFVSVGLRKHPELWGKPVAVTHARGNPRSQVREGMDRQYELNYYKDRAEKRLQAKMRPTNASRLTNANPEIDVFEENYTIEASKPPDFTVVPASTKKFSTVSLIDETSSMSEIASCSYEARKAGVKNGMFLGPALKLCPDLQTIPYDFEGYKEVSYKLYDIVASLTHDIEAVSCDEMFVDLTELLHTCQVTPEDFATFLREKVQEATSCPCSAGLGPNMLVARMATRLAKPNGQHVANPDNLLHYMKNQNVTGLPGVGWSLGKRLQCEGIHSCGDLQTRSLRQLQAAFGARTGQSLYYYCRGIDERPVKSEHVRKSVSAEVNYGIRFTCQSDADKFISELAVEVENRLTAVKLKGKCITLKLKIRAKDAPIETAKFMGHGVCDNVAKSVSLALATSSASVIEREVLSLLRQIKVQPQDFRGVGIQVSRLEGHQGTSGGSESGRGLSIKSFLLAAKINTKKRSGNSKPSPLKSTEMGNFSFQEDHKVGLPTTSSKLQLEPDYKSHPGTPQAQGSRTGHRAAIYDEKLPLTSKSASAGKGSIDPEVLMALPEDIRDEVVAEYVQQGFTIPNLSDSTGSDAVVVNDERKPSTSGYVRPSEKSGKQEYKTNTSDNSKHEEGSSAINMSELSGGNDLTDFARSINREFSKQENNDSEEAQNEGLITSFSQVDSSFLEALPEDIREELRSDLGRQKQAAVLSFSTTENMSRSPDKQQRLQGIDPVHGRGALRRRGRWKKTDPRRAEAEGLTTLTSIMTRQQPGNLSTQRVISGAEKKRTKQSKSKIPRRGTNSSPSKQNINMIKGHVTSGNKKGEEEPMTVASTSRTRNTGDTQREVDTEEVPHLCGVKEMSEVKSLIREWVLSCSHPEVEDGEILAHFYTSLISHHDLEKLDLLIKYLYRQVLRRQNKFWETTYRTLISRVQTVMLEHHHTKLKVLNL